MCFCGNVGYIPEFLEHIAKNCVCVFNLITCHCFETFEVMYNYHFQRLRGCP